MRSLCYENQFLFILKLELITITKISHLDSLWKREWRELGNGLFGVFEKFTSAYLFQIVQEKSCDYLLIMYMKNFEMGKQKKRTRITQSGKNCAINCAIQGVRLNWKQKIWLAICEFLWSLTNQNAWFVSSFCTELTLFCTVFKKNCTALNQSEWRIFFMYIIRYQTSW